MSEKTTVEDRLARLERLTELNAKLAMFHFGELHGWSYPVGAGTMQNPRAARERAAAAARQLYQELEAPRDALETRVAA